MEIQVLGPLRLLDLEGRQVETGGRGQRAVLEYLVARLGQRVTADELLMAVFGEDAAPRQRRTIHTYVARHRRTLGGHLVGDGSGYTLQRSVGSVDLAQFERLVEEGLTTLDPRRAAGLLGTGLALWRGLPFPDLETTAVLPSVQRLVSLRGEAAEAKFAADLLAGRHHLVAIEAGAYIADEPDRMPLRALHAIATHRSGRTGDAIEICQRAQDHRIGRGIPPSPDIATLEAALLDGGPIDVPRAIRPPNPSIRRPPGRTAPFVGRTHELDAIRRAIADQRLVSIVGLGGIGKTSLAVEALADVTEVVFVPLDRPTSADPYSELARSIGLLAVREFGDDQLVGTVAAHCAGPEWLILFDGAENELDRLVGLVAELLDAARNLRVLVTSRVPTGMLGERVVRVGPMTRADADRLFELRAPTTLGELGRESRRSVACLLDDVAGIPLGVELVAANLDRIVLVERESAVTPASQLQVRRPIGERQRSLVDVFEATLEYVGQESVRAFDRLGVLPTRTFGAEAAAAVIGSSASTALIELVEAGLVARAGDELHMLRPVHDHARRRSRNDTDGRRHHAAWVAEQAADIGEAELLGHIDRATELLDGLDDHIIAAVEWALGSDPTIADAIIEDVGRLWERVHDTRSLAETIRAHSGPHPPAVHAQLAHLLYHQDRNASIATLNRALVATDEHSDARTRLLVHRAAARLLLVGDDVTIETMESHWQSADRAAAELGVPTEPEFANRMLDLIAADRLDAASRLAETYLRWSAADDRSGRGRIRALQATISLLTGDVARAVELQREAVHLLRGTSNRHGRFEAELLLANLLDMVDDVEGATAALERADSLLQHANQFGAGTVRAEVAARIAGRRGDWDNFEHAVQQLDPDAPADYVDGSWSYASSALWLALPFARWLVTTADTDEALALARAGLRLGDGHSFRAWQASAEPRRLRELIEELEQDSTVELDLAIGDERAMWNYLVTRRIKT